MTATLTELGRTTPAEAHRMSECEFDLAVRWFLAVSRAA
jgi:hypothetical protein